MQPYIAYYEKPKAKVLFWSVAHMGTYLGQPKMAQMPTKAHPILVGKPKIMSHLLPSICLTYTIGNGSCDWHA